MAIEEVRNIDDVPLDEFKRTLGNATKQDLKNILKNVQKDKQQIEELNKRERYPEDFQYELEFLNRPFERVR